MVQRVQTISDAIPFAAISTAALASQRGYDLRDSDTYVGKFVTQLKNNVVKTHALAVDKDAGDLSNFERMMNISEENDHGRH